MARLALRNLSREWDEVHMKQLVFDIGAHDGTDSRMYLEQGFRVVAIEPNPHLADRLKESETTGDFLLER